MTQPSLSTRDLTIRFGGHLAVNQFTADFYPRTLTVIFGLLLILRAGESAPFAELGWDDAKHAAVVTAVTAVAIGLYEHLGFFFTMLLMMVILLVVGERRNPIRAGIYSLVIVLFTYVSFVYGLKTPLPEFSF